MKVHFITVGRPKDQTFAKAMADYVRRVRGHARVEFTHVREERRGSPEHVKREESKRLLDAHTGRAWRIALDEHGAQHTSVELAQHFQKWMNRGHSTWIIYVGGAHGHDPSLLKACDTAWSLSSLTLPHELALLIATEQVYRGFSILAGAPYHKP